MIAEVGFGDKKYTMFNVTIGTTIGVNIYINFVAFN